MTLPDLTQRIGEGFDTYLKCVSGQKSVQRKLDQFQTLMDLVPSNNATAMNQPIRH